jgi:hypothetical protein
MNDIQPVQDNTNPNRIKIGNANLSPNYAHNLNFQFNKWEAMTGRYVWTGINSSYTNNAFATNTFYDTLGRTVSNTINVDGNVFANFYAGFGLPVFNRKLDINPSLDGSIVRYTNQINNTQNITFNPTLGGGLDLELKFDSIEYINSKGIINYAINDLLINAIIKNYEIYIYLCLFAFANFPFSGI